MSIHQLRIEIRSQLQESLTERELQILAWAGQGLSMKGAAQVLGISSSTVRWHLKNTYLKLGATSREDALRIARADRLIASGLLCEKCACALEPARLTA